ncbi:hypothetical protein FEQ05_03191 [Burkholderia pseudomultivorans]|uniref:Uncharacterized protein n=1 Tax=Burkholderia pseudomultivorans TaxID=1207504 RepID=A0ABU2DX29_9BURK|nr:hypothetical protein [Burkholderia pseudomultivorans]MDR8776537.1 hypothetical protein [Burkholderia pseudomultivorans]MDR8819477.1 hypothetical protein [Burkholderia pseudomultivorans]MDR8830621.1 hypothetical protein [Burkholderia pseudomultivorans]MDR8847749.1 hypothetical protein [Burkholderia pseudomultivorans]
MDARDRPGETRAANAFRGTEKRGARAAALEGSLRFP